MERKEKKENVARSIQFLAAREGEHVVLRATSVRTSD
jgi:hypothetical protein